MLLKNSAGRGPYFPKTVILVGLRYLRWNRWRVDASTPHGAGGYGV